MGAEHRVTPPSTQGKQILWKLLRCWVIFCFTSPEQQDEAQGRSWRMQEGAGVWW